LDIQTINREIADICRKLDNQMFLNKEQQTKYLNDLKDLLRKRDNLNETQKDEGMD
jgi:hypothetical protein